MIVRRSRSDPRRRGRVRARPAPTVRRASARRRFSPRRALAALAMLGAAMAFYGLAASPAFGIRAVTTSGATLTGDAAVVAALALPTAAPDLPVDDSAGTTDAPVATAAEAAAPNIVTLDTSPLAARVATLPAVASVRVSASLPDVVAVVVTEREPILVWSVGEHRFLVDRDGRVLADAAAPDATAGATEAAAGLPAIVDERAAAAALGPGSVVDPIDLDVATRLASLTPEDIGSKAKEVAVLATDETGWELDVPDGWTAIFGFYTPSIRKADLIPAQVRLLRSLLGVREDRLKRAILASGDAGTYTLR
jgi:cell division septal protein FtsQ